VTLTANALSNIADIRNSLDPTSIDLLMSRVMNAL
jgi:hypothetical protein